MKHYHSERHEDSYDQSDATYLAGIVPINNTNDLINALKELQREHGVLPVHCIDDRAVDEFYGVHLYGDEVGIKLD